MTCIDEKFEDPHTSRPHLEGEKLSQIFGLIHGNTWNMHYLACAFITKSLSMVQSPSNSPTFSGSSSYIYGPHSINNTKRCMSFLTDTYIHIVSMAIGGCILKQIMIHVLTSCCILNGAKLWLLIRQNHCTSHILPNFSLIFPSSPTFT